MKLVLVGPRASGKTTVGGLLAKKWELDFLDLDDAVTEKSGKSPNQWIEENQENTFREWEARLLRDWLLSPRQGILATGGGSVMEAQSQSLLDLFKPVIWLRNSAASRKEIQEKAPRAALSELSLEKEIAELDEKRNESYGRVSDHEVNTDLSHDEVIAVFEKLRYNSDWKV